MKKARLNRRETRERDWNSSRRRLSLPCRGCRKVIWKATTSAFSVELPAGIPRKKGARLNASVKEVGSFSLVAWAPLRSPQILSALSPPWPSQPGHHIHRGLRLVSGSAESKVCLMPCLSRRRGRCPPGSQDRTVGKGRVLGGRHRIVGCGCTERGPGGHSIAAEGPGVLPTSSPYY